MPRVVGGVDCKICDSPRRDAINIALALGIASARTVGYELGMTTAAVKWHLSRHLKGWPERLRREIRALEKAEKQVTAKEMAEGVYQAAMGHIEAAAREGFSMTDLEHLRSPADIALRATEIVGKITGEIKPEAPAGLIGSNGMALNAGGSVAVLVMPRADQPVTTQQMGQALPEVVGPLLEGEVIDVSNESDESEEGDENGEEAEESDGSDGSVSV